MSAPAERALLLALDATYAALARPFKTTCCWCKATMISVAHPQSDGICDECLVREFPEDAPCAE
jgi:hypothetical protein